MQCILTSLTQRQAHISTIWAVTGRPSVNITPLTNNNIYFILMYFSRENVWLIVTFTFNRACKRNKRQRGTIALSVRFVTHIFYQCFLLTLLRKVIVCKSPLQLLFSSRLNETFDTIYMEDKYGDFHIHTLCFRDMISVPPQYVKYYL